MRPAVLVFAGLDPSGGAGIAADIEAIGAQGAHPLALVTALTVQDNNRVFEVQPVAPDLLVRQAEALIASIAIAAVKIGIPGSRANAEAIAAVLQTLRRRTPSLPVVIDPVLASGNGNSLARGDALDALAPLLPFASVLVPNLPEARALGRGGQGTRLREALGCTHLLITGGHAESESVRNDWFGPDGLRSWHWPRLPGQFHGSGCTLAAAVAGQLAMGATIAVALEAAQAFCHASLAQSYAIAPGQRIPLRRPTLH